MADRTSLAFYRDGMGLPTAGIVGQEFEDGAVVFIDMNEDFKLALFPAKSLSKDAKVALPQPRSGASRSLTPSVRRLIRGLMDASLTRRLSNRSSARTERTH